MSSESVESLSFKQDEYDYDVLSVDKKVLEFYNDALSRDTLPQDHDVSLKSSLTQLKSQNNPDNRLLMKYKDLEYLHNCLKESQTQGRS